MTTGSTQTLFNNLNIKQVYLQPNEQNPTRQNSVTRQILEWTQDINPLGYYNNYGTNLSSAIGVLEGSGGGAIYLPGGFKSTTTSTYAGVMLIYDGPQVPFTADQNPPSNGVADRLYRSDQHFASSTSSFIYYAVAIESQTNGQGADGPLQQNGGLFVSCFKTGWDTTSNRQSLNKGEIDSLQVWTRQAGPSALNGQGSDSSCILGNIEMVGDSGFSCFFEATNTNLNDDLSIHKAIDVQAGVITRANDPIDKSYGFTATMLNGTGDFGVLVQGSTSGTWNTGYTLQGPQGYVTGLDFSSVTFTSFALHTPGFIVDGAGDITGAEITLTGISAASLPGVGGGGTIITLANASTSAANGTSVTTGSGVRMAYSNGVKWILL